GSSSRRRDCAARCPAPIASTRSRRPDLQTASSGGILEHEPGDLTCIVDGAMRLSALGDALAQRGQRLSLDPPGDPTLADCLLGDLSGPLSHRLGTMRDLVLGATAVLPDGVRASRARTVVENA